MTLFWVIRDFFDTFLALRGREAGTTFLRLFGDFGRRGLGTPVFGGSNRNAYWESLEVTEQVLPRVPWEIGVLRAGALEGAQRTRG